MLSLDVYDSDIFRCRYIYVIKFILFRRSWYCHKYATRKLDKISIYFSVQMYKLNLIHTIFKVQLMSYNKR